MDKEKRLAQLLFKYNTMRANNMRPNVRHNEDGSVSSHLFASADTMAFPTLFPENGEWKESKGFLEALLGALGRGEVLSFDSKKDASRFAEGDWKMPLMQQLFKDYGIK